MTCKETTRRADEDDSEWRGTEMVATYKYPDLVKGCVVDRCPGPIMTFPRKKIRRAEEEEEEAAKQKRTVVSQKETRRETQGECDEEEE